MKPISRRSARTTTKPTIAGTTATIRTILMYVRTVGVRIL